VPHTFPIFLSVEGKRCVVIGSGEEAEAKASQLSESGALVERLPVDSPLDALNGAFLVVQADPDRSRNADFFQFAESKGFLLNCLDDPAHCRFIFSSIHRQGELILAISTGGACPALGVRIKQRFLRDFGPEYAVFLQICRTLRERLARRIPDFDTRRETWYRIVDSPILELLRQGKRAEAEHTLETLLPPDDPSPR
jgi:precorrin-2 dehydrogenase/sirohydrochlorin ferrochelatase